MKIKYEQVENYCNEMHGTINKMKDIVDEIKAEYLKIASSGMWDGPASDNYLKNMKKIIEGFDDTYLEVENAILFMAKVSDGYKAVDRKIMMEICKNLNITSPGNAKSSIF